MDKGIQLPGRSWRIISFIPGINWLSLLCLGGKCSVVSSTVCGIIYAIVTFSAPQLAAVPWLLTMIQYSATCTMLQRQQEAEARAIAARKRASVHAVSAKRATPPAQPAAHTYVNVALEGRPEQRQSIPPVSYQFRSIDPKKKFFADMKTFENEEGTKAVFVPFMSYWPTYDAMNAAQRAWYFCWRTQVRAGQYPETDLSYIFLHIYELLSGVGWQTAASGQDQLMRLWSAYESRFPRLTNYLQSWMFDFAQQHQLSFQYPPQCALSFTAPSLQADVMIDAHAAEAPLKLSFDLIDALCEYSLVGSKFYLDGHQALMREAIPRIVALTDAALRKGTQKGILATYGPTRTRKRTYPMYQSAVCPDAGTPREVIVKAYTDKIHLRAFINELVRYGENALRAANSCRGRLRGVELDEKLAELIDAFVKKEYGAARPTQTSPAKIALNFDSIQTLRQESDHVRDALRVEEEAAAKPLLTDLAEVREVYTSLSQAAVALLDRLHSSGWEMPLQPENQLAMQEINQAAEKCLGCLLLHTESERLVAEDDYRDELDEIYLHPPVAAARSGFSPQAEGLSPELAELLANLPPVQEETLRILMHEDHPQEALERLADQSMTLPQMLLDDLNESSLRSLGEILIDAADDSPHILDEYAAQLKRAVA